MVAEVLDGLILAWLIGTWFYEGNHKKCQVNTICPECGKKTDVTCTVHQNS